jgi:hypothetical protein
MKIVYWSKRSIAIALRHLALFYLFLLRSKVPLDTGHFFHTCLTQCLVFLGIL